MPVTDSLHGFSFCHPFQALGDRDREPGRLYDLEYESDEEEPEEEKVIQNPSQPR